ncbi:DUF4926 domain-containing protein [Fannyhessea vaginae]|uniref:DUF4926 domain-containing protein n=1 Tax=Fannyhessea vaginae TaxID=82135 RepID=UPI0026E97C29|nr:DUF4926 domain-containing protein [Fannyhessea vaginae]
MKEFDIVKLKENFQGINAGTEGTIVLEYDRTAFEVEFVDENLDTIEVITTPANLLELVQSYK